LELEAGRLGRREGERRALDLRRVGELVGADAVLRELPHGHEQAGLERAERLVVGADGGVEAAADLGEVADEDADAVVELAAELVDRPRVWGCVNSVLPANRMFCDVRPNLRTPHVESIQELLQTVHVRQKVSSITSPSVPLRLARCRLSRIGDKPQTGCGRLPIRRTGPFH